jgi:hypothetical protein
MTPDEGEEGGIWKLIGIFAMAAGVMVLICSIVALHNLVLVPAQLKHDGRSSSVPAAGMGLRMLGSRCAARAALRPWQGLLRIGD